MNDDKFMISEGIGNSPDDMNNALGGSRKSVFPLRYHDLGGTPLIELWDLSRADSPESLVCSIASLEKRIGTGPCLPPGAFIFHCSRCGSTLLARLFAMLATNRVFNEPGAFHAFRDAHWNGMSNPGVQRNLKVLIEAYGLDPVAQEVRLIIKFDSRAVLAVGALRRSFPDVPFIYLLRKPADVIASLVAAPPGFLGRENRAALSETLGGAERELADYTPEEWAAWYLSRNLETALAQAKCFSDVVDYETFATHYLPLVNRISGSHLTGEARGVQAILSRHSKNPSAPFSPGRSQDSHSFAVREAADRMVGEAYGKWGGNCLNRSGTGPQMRPPSPLQPIRSRNSSGRDLSRSRRS